jgi:hypothetical protein
MPGAHLEVDGVRPLHDDHLQSDPRDHDLRVRAAGDAEAVGRGRLPGGPRVDDPLERRTQFALRALRRQARAPQRPPDVARDARREDQTEDAEPPQQQTRSGGGGSAKQGPFRGVSVGRRRSALLRFHPAAPLRGRAPIRVARG